jgi:hypothetical protein
MKENETLLAATPDDEISEAMAKEYIKANGYTADTVKLVKTDGQIRVIRR